MNTPKTDRTESVRIAVRRSFLDSGYAFQLADAKAHDLLNALSASGIVCVRAEGLSHGDYLTRMWDAPGMPMTMLDGDGVWVRRPAHIDGSGVADGR